MFFNLILVLFRSISSIRLFENMLIENGIGYVKVWIEQRIYTVGMEIMKRKLVRRMYMTIEKPWMKNCLP